MAELKKIYDVVLYGTLDEHVLEVYNLKKYLEDQGIEFRVLFYVNDASAALAALSTWELGDRGSTSKRDIPHFPVLVWSERYDDEVITVNIAQSIAELQTKPLEQHKGDEEIITKRRAAGDEREP